MSFEREIFEKFLKFGEFLQIFVNFSRKMLAIIFLKAVKCA